MNDSCRRSETSPWRFLKLRKAEIRQDTLHFILSAAHHKRVIDRVKAEANLLLLSILFFSCDGLLSFVPERFSLK